jgi:hypothetical protein
MSLGRARGGMEGHLVSAERCSAIEKEAGADDSKQTE